LEGLPIENLGIFYDHLIYFTVIGNILWPFGIFRGRLVYFSPFWYFVPRKIWQPWRLGRDFAATEKSEVIVSCKEMSVIPRQTRWWTGNEYLKKYICALHSTALVLIRLKLADKLVGLI
jgi:hypothetical protein